MSKSVKQKSKVSSPIGYVEPYIENFDKLRQKQKQMNACWKEIQRLQKEIDEMDYPIKYRLSWTEE